MVSGCGVHISEVALQKLAVRVGLAQQNGDSASVSKQHDAGVICAARGAEVSSIVHHKALLISFVRPLLAVHESVHYRNLGAFATKWP